MVTFESFRPDITAEQWQFYKEDDTTRLWFNPARDLMQQRLVIGTPSDLPANYPHIETQRAYFARRAPQMKCAVVAVDSLLVQDVEGFSTLLKFRSPQNPAGHLYFGTMMFTLEQFSCIFQFQADEFGATGNREETVTLILRSNGKLPPEADHAPLNSVDDLVDALQTPSPMPHVSDEAQYDSLFPDHPLSRVRRYMHHLAETIVFDDEVRQARPFRGAEWKP